MKNSLFLISEFKNSKMNLYYFLEKEEYFPLK